MAKATIRPLLRYLRRAVGEPAADPAAVDALLEQFVARQDEDAFAGLVDRFGPMVQSVCRRVLGDAHEAEDAFQATFLVLARKAASIRQSGALGGWLYRVACHLALEARARSARLRTTGQPLAELPDREEDAGWRDARPLLDEELHRLPDKYCAPIRLHYLEGMTTEQAARELGWPKGTLLSRLDRGRDLLRQRLARRGVGISTVAVGGLLTGSAAAAVPATATRACLAAALAGQASPDVISLAEGAMGSMFYSKVRLAAALLLVLAMVASGAGVLLHATLAGELTPVSPGEARPEPFRVGEHGAIRGVATDAALSRDGRLLAVQVTDPTKQRDINGWKMADISIQLIDLATLKATHAVAAPPGTIVPAHTAGMELGPDGRFLVLTTAAVPKINPGVGLGGAGGGGFGGIGGFGGLQPGFLVWDVAKRKVSCKLPASVTAAQIAPGGDQVVTVQSNGDIKIWHAETGKEKRSFRTGVTAGAGASVPLLRISPDGSRAALVSFNPQTFRWSVRAWELASGKPLAGKTLGQITLWSPHALAFSPDGKTLAMVEGAGVKLWDAASGKDLATLRAGQQQASADGVVFSPEGSSLAVRVRVTGAGGGGFGGGGGGGFGGLAAGNGSGEVVVFDAASHRERFRTAGTSYNSQALGAPGIGSGMTFSPDGKLLALVEETGGGQRLGLRVKLLDAVTGKLAATLDNQATIIGFAPQGHDRMLLLTVPPNRNQPAALGSDVPGQDWNIKVWELRGDLVQDQSP